MIRTRVVLVTLVAALGSCGQSSVPPDSISDLVPTDPAAVRQLLADSDRPVLLNVWASWCTPCRSEAPLLRAAHAEYGERVQFIGIDVRDSQDGARSFIAEFGLDGFEHLFDAAGAVPADLGGFGVPLTFFFAPGGELMSIHSGVIDERTLALDLDELVAGTP